MENLNRNDLPRLLRIVGVAAMLLSGAVFLFQGLQELNQFYRFLGFTGLTLATGLLGVFCAKKLQEPKGARTLLALATTAIPVLYSQFGAMVYELRSSPKNTLLPDYFQFEALPFAELAICAGIVVIVGSAVSYLGFSVLDREQRRPYWITFLLLNTLLILPLRSGYFLLAPILALALGVWYLRRQAKALEDWRMTPERVVASALILLPVLITLTRSFFYDLDLLGLSAVLYFFAIASTIKDISKPSAEPGKTSLSLTMFGTVALGLEILRPLEGVQQIVGLTLVLHFILKIFLRNGVRAAKPIMSAVWLLGTIVVIDMLVFNSLFKSHANSFASALFIFAAGALGTLEGFHLPQKKVFFGGLGLSIVGIILNISLALTHVNVLHWLNLAVAGAIVLVTASILERHQSDLRNRWSMLMKRLSA